MRTQGAVIHGVGERWQVEDLELGEPNDHEVLIEVAASGICHSDAHLVDGDLAVDLPFVGGHEGAGVVVAAGDKVSRVAVGDRVCTAFIPACGRCSYCARGMSYVCDNGFGMEHGISMDGTPRFFLDAERERPIGALCRLGTFAGHLVCSEQQAIPVDPSVPLDVACLVSCGVATGFGAAVNVGEVKPGDVVLVVGFGGVGANVVQGARRAGATHVIVAEPRIDKHERAREFGATDAFASIAEALPRIHELTNGQGADVALVTVGRVDGDVLGEAFGAVGKTGTCVLVAVGQSTPGIAISPQDLTNLAKSVKGVMFGNCNPAADIPRLLTMYQEGALKLDELITRRYSLDEINEAFDDLGAGTNIRGVLIHEH